jgi:four helix bundle protein
MMSHIKSYRDLEVWQKAMQLAELCYRWTDQFPKRELYALASQIQRAAVSIASNVAEGHSRRSRQAYLNHLSIAMGSQSEVETQIELASRLGMISIEDDAHEILALAGQVGRMLHALIAALEGGSSERELALARPQSPAPSP